MRSDSRFVWIIAAVVVVGTVGGLVYLNVAGRQKGPMIFVGSSMQKPMDKCIAAFEKKTGVKIKVNYGDSGDVLAMVKKSGRGEAAVIHEPYVTELQQAGYGSSTHVLAWMTPVIVVAKGNPKHIRGLRDFIRDDLKDRIGVTNADYTPSGRIVQAALANAGIQKQFMDRHPLEEKSSGTLVVDVKTNELDAVTVWDAVARNGGDKVEWLPIEPALMPAKFRDKSDTYDVTFTDGHVAVGLVVLKTDKFKAETKRFVDFLLSPEGRAIWKANGYEIEPVAPTTQPTTKP